MKIDKLQTITASDEWKNLSGALPVKMTNDYLFRILMEADNGTLKALLSALLGVKRDEIVTATIENPIVPGKTIHEKELILDVKVMLNNHTILDLEMQVLKGDGWTERTVLYLSRLYDRLYRGDKYSTAKPAIHIGIVDFTPDENNPVFYSVNMLTDTKTQHIYTDIFQLRYLNLTKIDNATETDKQNTLDQWARMFKSTTWEELKMLAAKNEDIDQAISYSYSLISDEELQEQMLRREEITKTLKARDERMKRYEKENKEFRKKLVQKDKQLDERDKQLDAKDKQLDEKDKQLDEKDKQLDVKDKQLNEKDDQLREKDMEMAVLRAENDDQLKEIDAMRAEIARLKARDSTVK